MKKWILLCLVLLVASNASANFITGNDLIENCTKEQENQYLYTHCMGFIVGVYDGFSLANNKPIICKPESASLNQVTKVLLKFLKKHPEKLHESGSYLLLLSLKEAFPCSNNK